MNMSTHSLRLELPETLASSARARKLCSTLLSDLAIQQTLHDELLLVVGELCNNAILHGASAVGKFDVELICCKSYVQVLVRDYGRGFDPHSLQQAKMDTFFEDFDLPVAICSSLQVDGTVRIGGMGLFTVQSLMDSVDFETVRPSGTCVIAQRRLPVLENVQ